MIVKNKKYIKKGLSVLIFFLFFYLIFKYLLLSSMEDRKNVDVEVEIDLKLNENFKKINHKNLEYVGFDYWGKVNSYDKDLNLINSLDFSNEYPKYWFWKSKLNDNLIWVGLDRFRINMDDREEYFNSKKIYLLNISNFEIQKKIDIGSLSHPFDFCFDSSFAYVTTFQNGFDFGFLKINLNTLDVEFSKIFSDSGILSYPELFCGEDSIFILTSSSLSEINKKSLESKKIFSSQELAFSSIQVSNQSFFFYSMVEEINQYPKYFIGRFEISNGRYDHNFIELDISLKDFVFDEIENQFIISTYDDELIFLDISGNKINVVKNFISESLVRDDRIIFGSNRFYDLDSKKEILVEVGKESFYDWQSLIKIN